VSNLLAASAFTSSGPALEPKPRRLIVNLIFVMFWTLIFEGAIRKWVAPQFSSYLYFLRDPLTLVIYYLAVRARVFTPLHPLLLIGALLAFIAMSISALNLLVGGTQYNLILAVYGFRNYFFYLPLPFVVLRVFTYPDLCRLARHSILALALAAPIAVLQFEASPSSVLNVGIADDAELQFGNLASGDGRVRPAGTFTSVMGMTQLTVSTLALLLWCATSSRRPRPVPKWLMIIGGVAVAVALSVSGSRTSFLQAGLVVAAATVMGLPKAARTGRIGVILTPVLLVACFLVLFPVVFPDAYTTFMQRWSDAAATEAERFQYGWIGRALYSFYDFSRLLGQVPLLGYGVGMAGNGAVNMGVMINGESVLKLAEEDWSRHVIELGPVVAVFFIGFRVAFALWLGARAVRSSMQSGELLPVLLFAYVVVALTEGQLTGHGLVNGFGWLYVGVCMAAANAQAWKFGEPSRAGNRRPPAYTPRFPNLMT
jgi:hypothetical protein